ncbi:hypothetical protein Aoki45_02120 [Algoriphagus sp. oki45]|uniref:hypothetical protein n=1 Tax=Algoriphagus sp. oki45 TaxID=3067294 RepID=UPI0027E8DD1E|nr:hypothetical protein Aoki45_02120 [Algoriphagus sp. oki45]
MKSKASYAFLSQIKGHLLCRIWFGLVLVNFINLSVNFQESSIIQSETLELEDPIDTLGELVYEWALEGDCDVIPDNGTEQEDKSTKKAKDWFSAKEFEFLNFFSSIEKKKFFNSQEDLVDSPMASPFSPPDLS